MNPRGLLCALPATALALSATALAYDSDLGNPDNRPYAEERSILYHARGNDRTWYLGRGNDDDRDSRFSKPAYYVPTQRYYGPGYTVSYRYLPVSRYGGEQRYSSNFRTEAFHIETKDIADWKSKPPRLTVTETTPRREPVTTIIRKKSATQKTPPAVGGPALAANPAVLPATAPESPIPLAAGAAARR